MDIYAYVKKDHRVMADLMEQVVASGDSEERAALFEIIKLELILHTDAEEMTFYYALDKASRSNGVRREIEHARDEHDEIRDYIEKLSSLPYAHEEWFEKFGEFKHAVDHHVKEEEGEVFESAKEYLSKKEAEALAKQMDYLKKTHKRELLQM